MFLDLLMLFVLVGLFLCCAALVDFAEGVIEPRN